MFHLFLIFPKEAMCKGQVSGLFVAWYLTPHLLQNFKKHNMPFFLAMRTSLKAAQNKKA